MPSARSESASAGAATSTASAASSLERGFSTNSWARSSGPAPRGRPGRACSESGSRTAHGHMAVDTRRATANASCFETTARPSTAKRSASIRPGLTPTSTSTRSAPSRRARCSWKLKASSSRASWKLDALVLTRPHRNDPSTADVDRVVRPIPRRLALRRRPVARSAATARSAVSAGRGSKSPPAPQPPPQPLLQPLSGPPESQLPSPRVARAAAAARDLRRGCASPTPAARRRRAHPDAYGQHLGQRVQIGPAQRWDRRATGRQPASRWSATGRTARPAAGPASQNGADDGSRRCRGARRGDRRDHLRGQGGVSTPPHSPPI